ncbi:predicted protein [Arabidopsis lyrata subsp. lyrata]|uniref:Predicted protein n=1 Tax=Arabidopsis lyrata subsp. lyrata TaxID=81972 RepID=D7LIX8_ARALL|nr:predicted protein [Arabidopsis lyrata subsp. lyrata]
MEFFSLYTPNGTALRFNCSSEAIYELISKQSIFLMRLIKLPNTTMCGFQRPLSLNKLEFTVKHGDFFTFKPNQRGGTLALRLSVENPEEDEECSSEASEVVSCHWTKHG